jgi:hypothetical protein
MPDGDRLPFPFLPLPSAETAERGPAWGRAPKISGWEHAKQSERVGLQLQRLQDALENQRLELRGELAGIEPELALVIETIGSVQNFQKAVGKIPGLEWLAEEPIEEMAPGEDFFETDKEEKLLGGTLYLVMSDRRAVEQLLSLWGRYRRDEKVKLEKNLNPWREAFRHARTIRPWGPEDRIRDTGLLEDWRDRLEWGSETVRAQVELWFRHHEGDRRRQLRELESALERSGGRLIGQSVTIPEIAYHGCVVEVPRAVATDLVERRDVDLLLCEGITFLRPVGQMAVVAPTDEEPAPGLEKAPEESPPAAEDAQPLAGLLDGLPLEHHAQLRGRLLIDDPDDWAAETPAADRHHGTAMASLIAQGDLVETAGLEPLRRPVYVRPVLRSVSQGPLGARELMPEDVLEVDLVHRAVRRMLEGEGDDEPVAPEVLVVNFSIGDLARPYERHISPLARLLDWLSWKYGVLFVVSAGNPACAERLELECSREDLRSMEPEERRRLCWQALVNQAHLRRVLAPAESINALTLGGEHADAVTHYEPQDRIDPFGAEDGVRLPSPVTAFGTGINRSLKPEIFSPAGRQLYRESYSTGDSGAKLDCARTTVMPPGQRAAAPGRESGRTDQTRYTCGTSNAAALTTRAAAQVLERLPDLLAAEPLGFVPDRKFLVPLVKALLVHGARWEDSRDLLEGLLADEAGTGATDRLGLGRFLGYGFPNGDVLQGCHEQRATLCGWDELEDGEGHVYRIPLPPSLAGIRAWRRLTVTLAWLTPANPQNRRYRRAHLWFDPKISAEKVDSAKLLKVDRRDADSRASRRGTVQHEIFEGEKAAVFAEEDALVLKVSCRAEAGELVVPVPYALVVSLEVAPGLDVPIYDEMRVRLRPRARIRP